jgi:hypothetical protein
MPSLLIKLNNSPVDEVNEIQQLLEENAIDFYETDAGRWGVSVAGFWLRDNTQLERAHDLLHKYQQERAERVRGEYEARHLAGERDSILHRLFQAPLRVLLYLLAILTVIYLTLMPFIQLMGE